MPTKSKSGESKRTITVTARKLAANRKNAQKSTGPQTAEGKTRAALNATTHGLTARSLILQNSEDECIEDFIKLHVEFQVDLNPVGRLEQSLVQQIAICNWRLNRAYRYESQSVLDQQQSAQRTSRQRRSKHASLSTRNSQLITEASSASLVLPEGPNFDRLIRYESLINRELHRSLTRLTLLQKRRRKEERSNNPLDPDDPDDDNNDEVLTLEEANNMIDSLTSVALVPTSVPEKKENMTPAPSSAGPLPAQSLPAVVGGGCPAESPSEPAHPSGATSDRGCPTVSTQSPAAAPATVGPTQPCSDLPLWRPMNVPAHEHSVDGPNPSDSQTSNLKSELLIPGPPNPAQKIHESNPLTMAQPACNRGAHVDPRLSTRSLFPLLVRLSTFSRPLAPHGGSETWASGLFRMPFPARYGEVKAKTEHQLPSAGHGGPALQTTEHEPLTMND